MIIILIISYFGQNYNTSTRIQIDGKFSFEKCNWIDCKTNGHGGCIFFSYESSTLSISSCSFVKGECVGSDNQAGGICVQHCKSISIESTCFFSCFSNGGPSYVLWSCCYNLMESRLDQISEVMGKSNLHGSVSGGRDFQQITNLNCSMVRTPVYCGGVAFHPCGSCLLGRYCQVCDSYTEGMVSFYVGSRNHEFDHWNLINNTIPSGCWFCFHNQNPSIVIKSTIIKLTSHMTSLFSMNGGATLSFYDCSFDVDNIYSFFGARATNCSFLTPVSNHMISIYSNGYCIDMNKKAHTSQQPSKHKYVALFFTFLHVGYLTF